ncbi:MAG TPA: Asp-tRNA(Asn)/Glu-tRNA(Gln) amidotransferase subunit GatC [Phycisphaerae bacterium]|nr:Asp-tRNA(Asn)/Glu-tRNA(Gln) amidotransferase subunit GatC [Phycisphaerae bacterium]HPS52640.1 Asp-tRNA(Asn)/Glu-tRNA(Gln) amidotransferase subunit GatC [Phycisphaerae bacterium]
MPAEITTDIVRHIGQLSRIELTDAEVETFAKQLGDVLKYFDKLNELDTDGVQPMAHAVELVNVLADDVVSPGLTVEQALANAPAREGNFYKVPKVLGDAS